MPSYVVTGVSRGLGYEFLRQISSDSKNTVVGIVRNKATFLNQLSEELKTRSNIHILQADVTDYAALKQAAADTSRITNGSLDYLIANAGLVSAIDRFAPIGELGNNPIDLENALLTLLKTNLIAQIHLFNLFLPLILKGKTKKVIAISSGHADPEIITNFDIDVASLYTISKAALNSAVAKFSAQYSKDGVLFLSVCPGMVDTGHFANPTEEEQKTLGALMGKFQSYAPNFTGPAQPEEAIRDVLAVVDKASVENGDGGAFLSHKGNKQWL